MNKRSDTILLHRVEANHDPEAFAELYDRYVKQIYRFIYFKVSGHEEAEDLTADVFLKTWNYIQEGKEVKSFSGLLYRIARNTIIDLYRSKAAAPESVSLYNEEIEVGDENAWLKKIDISIEHQGIVQAIKKLKQEYQEVVTLRFIDDLSIEEIAEITGKKKIAVRVTLHRALKKLQQFLKQHS
jgi:RNA polymerase sigma-70 factor (ECF subfamily)